MSIKYSALLSDPVARYLSEIYSFNTKQNYFIYQQYFKYSSIPYFKINIIYIINKLMLYKANYLIYMYKFIKDN